MIICAATGGGSLLRKITRQLVRKFKEFALALGLLPGIRVVRVSEE